MELEEILQKEKRNEEYIFLYRNAADENLEKEYLHDRINR